MAVEMELVGVRVRMPSNAPILLLRETEGRRRTVPIYIGGPEAHAIDLALSGTETSRPMTHDLFVSVMADLGATLEKVILTDLKQGTFYAELILKTSTGETQTISARPSDAVALAVRSNTPILAESLILDEAGIEERDETEVDDEDEMVEELRRFLDEVKPEDFKT